MTERRFSSALGYANTIVTASFKTKKSYEESETSDGVHQSLIERESLNADGGEESDHKRRG